LYKNDDEPKKSLFTALADALSVGSDGVEVLKNECTDYMKSCKVNNEIPDKLSWILKEIGLMDDYIKDPCKQIFEALTLEILSY